MKGENNNVKRNFRYQRKVKNSKAIDEHSLQDQLAQQIL